MQLKEKFNILWWLGLTALLCIGVSELKYLVLYADTNTYISHGLSMYLAASVGFCAGSIVAVWTLIGRALYYHLEERERYKYGPHEN